MSAFLAISLANYTGYGYHKGCNYMEFRKIQDLPTRKQKRPCISSSPSNNNWGKANGPLVRPVGLFLLFFLLDLDHLAALIKSTVWADNVLQDHGAAVGAGYQAGWFQRVVGPAAVTAAFRQFSLGMRGHLSYSLFFPLVRGQMPRQSKFPEEKFWVKRADYSSEAQERQV
jgi:hypothetical protein